MKSSSAQATIVFHALSDETRFRVARLLICSGLETTPGQLSRALDIPPSHLSRHLQLLQSADLISFTKNGKSKKAKISNSDGHLGALYAAVMAMPDETGIFAGDMDRLLKMMGHDYPELL